MMSNTLTNVVGEIDELNKQIFQLWKLLDDIDTLDDAVKSNDKAFREHTRTMIKKRFTVVPEGQLDELYDNFYGEKGNSK